MSTLNFMATFAPGFETCISDLLLRFVPDARNIRLFSGMIVFSTNEISVALLDAGFFNNIFFIAKEWNSPSITFTDMVNSSIQKDCLTTHKKNLSEVLQLHFRVRFSRANQFAKVDRSLMERSEKYISKSLEIKPDRLSSGTEFWFLIRKEGLSFFMLRLTQREISLNDLHQGELRPEIALLLVAHSSPQPTDVVVADPFAGYGSIPDQLSSLLPQATIYASDSDSEMFAGLQKRFLNKPHFVTHLSDARNLDFLADSSVDIVVTDPPWGIWDNKNYSDAHKIIALYTGFLTELDRILSARGRACILTGAKREFEEAVSGSSSFAHNIDNPQFRTDILVNGKKSAVFLVTKIRSFT